VSVEHNVHYVLGALRSQQRACHFFDSFMAWLEDLSTVHQVPKKDIPICFYSFHPGTHFSYRREIHLGRDLHDCTVKRRTWTQMARRLSFFCSPKDPCTAVRGKTLAFTK
jgi:hypothetical protein